MTQLTQAHTTQAHTTQRDDLVTTALCGWVVAGMVLDAWAHQNASQLETFFTPWHAVLTPGSWP
jgi:hypothetical protein